MLTGRGPRLEDGRDLVPSHSVVRQALWEQLAAQRQLLVRVARALPEMPVARTAAVFDWPPQDTYAPHQTVALVLIRFGVAQEAGFPVAALERVLFELQKPPARMLQHLMVSWPLVPEVIKTRFFTLLADCTRVSPQIVREVAGFLWESQVEPAAAWRILDLLFEEPERGRRTLLLESSPWSYLFQHLDEAPEGLLTRLDAWAHDDPRWFTEAMCEGLLWSWDRLPGDARRWSLWRGAILDRRSWRHPVVRERLVPMIARRWSQAPQALRELFDFQSRSSDWAARALVAARALFYAEDAPELEVFALAGARDHNPHVRLQTVRWGRGDDLHRRIVDMVLADANPGLAACIALDLADEAPEMVPPWRDEVMAECLRRGGDLARAGIAYAAFEGRGQASAEHLEPRLAELPFDEPEAVQAAWIWAHLNSLRGRPKLSDDDLERLLRGLKVAGIRMWCLFYVSQQITVLPDRFAQLLGELAAGQGDDATAIAEGAKRRPSSASRPLLSFCFLLMQQ